MNIGNPSLSSSPLSARQDQAASRGVDAVLNMMEWAPPHRKPASSGHFVTRSAISAAAISTRVLFTGNFWMTDAPVAAWRPIAEKSAFEKPFRPVAGLHHSEMSLLPKEQHYDAKAEQDKNRNAAIRMQSQLVESKFSTINAPARARTFDECALVPIDGELSPELASVKKLAELELRVEVIRFLKPQPGSAGISSGKVLAISENYSAQQHGKQGVVVHENRNLDRAVAPGELVTMSYDSKGSATVFDGLAHDIRIDAAWMDQDQKNYMRMVMLDALSMIHEPMEDDLRLKAAMQYALESTAKFFGLEQSRLRLAEIELSINEVAGPSFSDPCGQDGSVSQQKSRRPGM